MNVFHYILIAIDVIFIMSLAFSSYNKKDNRTKSASIFVFFMFLFLIIGSAYYGCN